MKGPTLRQLEYFVAVVEAGSLTEAAKQCHVSVGAIGLAMNDLETALGIKLISRQKSKGITVTPAGRIAAEKANVVLHHSREFLELPRMLHDELVGPLTIGCFGTVSPLVLPGLLEHFATEHPNVKVDIVEGSAEELQALLLAGKLDACIVYATHLAKRVRGIKILDVRLNVVVSVDDELAARSSVAFHELQGRPAVLMNLPPAADAVENLMRMAGLVPNVQWRSSNVETVRSIVARGLAYGVLNNLPLPSFYGPRLHHLQIEDPLPDNALVAAVPREIAPSAKIREAIKCCRNLIEKTASS